jgi:outer membrane immunogenic protein
LNFSLLGGQHVEDKMRKDVIAMAGLALVAAIGPTRAADMQPGYPRPYAAPAPAYAVYNWMGPYIGANVGYQWGSVTHDPADPAGGAIGGQIGYNWQNGQFVFGVETDLQWANADDVVFPQKFSNSWFGTARGRVGYAMNNILAYGTGGFAYGNLKLETAGLTETLSHYGWTLGVGMEVGLTPNWTAKVEYLYFDLTDKTYFTGVAHGLESSVLRAGVNYRF